MIGIADTVLLVLMPGSGDSVQALKAGIMEIPDVIAINKMDHPAAKTMLNEVRSILALDRDRAWRAPIVLTEAVRGENVPELWAKIEEHRALPGVRTGCSRSGGGRTSPVRCSRAATSRAKAHLAGDGRRRAPSCGACSTRCRPASSTRSRLCVRSWNRCTALTTAAAPTLTDLEAARGRIAGIARVTPVYPSETLSRRAGRTVQLKAENLQRTGAFKIRGAVNTIASLTAEERAAGVVAASAGNHGQAVAWAAREAGIAASVFMPEDSPMAKVEATRNYGAHVELAGSGFDEALAAATEEVASERRHLRARLRGRARDRRARARSGSSSPSSCRDSRRS